MDKTRKCIAVLISEVCEAYQMDLVNGIRKRANELNYNVAVFAAFFSTKIDSALGEKGENKIFQLINYDLFEGFIVLPNSLTESVIKEVEKNFKKIGKPVVYIDRENPDFYNVCADDYNSFKHITNHLIKDHGLTRINCLTGFPGMNISDNRLRGYMDALRENNIEVEEDRYAYGDFWIAAPVKFVDHIFSCGLELPQAVVCANDTMAIAVCEAIQKHGLRVPEDIAVTGHDRIIDGKVFHPQIASMQPALNDMGERTVDIIIDLLAGKETARTHYIPGLFYPTESCGCPVDISDKEQSDIGTLKKSVELSQYFINSIYMYEQLQECKDADEMFNSLSKFLYMLDGIKSLHVFVNENWDVLNEKEVKEKNYDRTFDEYCLNRYAFCSDGSIYNIGKIKTSDIFPPLFDDKYTPDVYFIFPLNFQNIAFGYIICTCTKEVSVPNSIFRNWTKYISNAMEHIRSQKHLEWALKRIERISEIDALTGVYNRLGYDNRIHKRFEEAKREHKDFMVIMGDLDCLKGINDNFGHAEGDNAIRIIAKALQNSYTEDEVCARFGGDEFIMFGTGSFSEERLKEYPVRINEYLDHYNQNSSKPYLIKISIGIYCNKVDESSTLQEWLNKADENMYNNKKNKVKVYLKDPQ